MRWSLRVARIDGTDIKIHWSFVLVIPYFLNVTQPEGLSGLLFALLVLLLLFVCVALHELGHSFVAGRLGIPTRHIVLWPLGGFAVLSRQPERPLHQAAIFGAAPLVNVLLAGGLFLAAQGLAEARAGWPAGWPALPYVSATLRILVNVNIALALFNLIPAYPLDGGRIVRALLVALAGERRADRVMLVVSWLFAGTLGAYGALGGDWLLVVLAVLVFFVAGLLSNRFAELANRVFTYLFDRPDFYMLRGDTTGALGAYGRLIEHYSSRAALYRRRAALHRRAGDYARAIVDYDPALALEPGDAEIYFHRGAARYHNGDYNRAFADADLAILRTPAAGLIHDEAWLAAHVKGDLGWAMAYYDRAACLRPADPRVYQGRADACRVNGEHERALADYGRAIELAPGRAEAYLGRGLVYREQGAEGLATADFRRALELSAHTAVRRRAEQLLARPLADNGSRCCWQGP